MQNAADLTQKPWEQAILINGLFPLMVFLLQGMKGIPCIGLGPGNEIYAHSPNKHARLVH